jgi:hypothetical protein
MPHSPPKPIIIESYTAKKKWACEMVYNPARGSRENDDCGVVIRKFIRGV